MTEKRFAIGDRVEFCTPSLKYKGTVQDILRTGIVVVTDNRKATQPSLLYTQKIPGEGHIVGSKRKRTRPDEIIMTITLISGAMMTGATIMAERGDLAYLHAFTHVEGKTDWNAVVAGAQKKLIATEIQPPPTIKTTKEDIYDPKKAVVEVEKKPTYVLDDTDYDMPWEEYPAFYADASEPLVGEPTVSADTATTEKPATTLIPIAVSKPMSPEKAKAGVAIIETVLGKKPDKEKVLELKQPATPVFQKKMF